MIISKGSLVSHIGHSNFSHLIEITCDLTVSQRYLRRFFSHERWVKRLKPGHLHALKIGSFIETWWLWQMEQFMGFLEERVFVAYFFISSALTKLIVSVGSTAG